MARNLSSSCDCSRHLRRGGLWQSLPHVSMAVAKRAASKSFVKSSPLLVMRIFAHLLGIDALPNFFLMHSYNNLVDFPLILLRSTIKLVA